MHFQLAWRNIWRNTRRTGVILTAVVIGVWSMIFLGALMRGMTDGMVSNAIATLTGHVQIHQAGYRRDPSVEHRIGDVAAVARALETVLPAGAHTARRVRVAAVANNARHSTGVTLVGIEPQAEAKVSFIGRAVKEGRYLRPDESNGILVGRALAERFGTGIGHKLILMSQDRHQEIASRAFRIRGIYRAEMEATEKQFVFVPLDTARKMLDIGADLSEIAVVLPDAAQAGPVAAALSQRLPAGTEAAGWHELLPLVEAYIRLMDGFIGIWFLVVFVAMGFGIVNTTLMAVFERMREFGLLKALGQRPGGIVRGVLTESFLLLLCGMAAGNLLALASIRVLAGRGLDLSVLAAGAEYAGLPRVIYPVVTAGDVVIANAVVLILGLLVSLYPAVKAARFSPVQAMMQH